MLGKVFLGPWAASLDTGEPTERISRVDLLVDSDHMYTAGDDTGRTIEKTCPWGSQAMAESILASLRGADYRPYAARDGLLDPAAEVGDGITVGGVYSVLAQTDITFDALCTAGVSAPGGDEVEDEYPYRSRAVREADRQLARTRSSITKTAERITLMVENEVDGLAAQLELTASSLTSRISATDGRVSSLKQFVDSITLEVSNGSTSSSITLKSGSAAIASQTIQMNGLVTFSGLQNGTTTINGACIKTGTIDANRLNLTGAITFNDLSGSLQDDIDGAWDKAQSAQLTATTAYNTVSSWSYGGMTYIDGSKIMADTVMASNLLGGTVKLLDGRQNVVGGLSITSTHTGYGVELYTNTGGIRINPGGNFWVDASGGSMGITEAGVVSGADLVPLSTGRYALGRGGLRWTDVYADNGTIVTSDREKKQDISYTLDLYRPLFDALRPVCYRLRDGTGGRTHLGLIAQDVEEALETCGLSGQDFAGFIKAPREDGGADYALRYEEFIALLIGEVQELKRQINTMRGGAQ